MIWWILLRLIELNSLLTTAILIFKAQLKLLLRPLASSASKRKSSQPFKFRRKLSHTLKTFSVTKTDSPSCSLISYRMPSNLLQKTGASLLRFAPREVSSARKLSMKKRRRKMLEEKYSGETLLIASPKNWRWSVLLNSTNTLSALKSESRTQVKESQRRTRTEYSSISVSWPIKKETISRVQVLVSVSASTSSKKWVERSKLKVKGLAMEQLLWLSSNLFPRSIMNWETNP